MSYNQEAWTVNKKTNIFHLDSSGIAENTIILDGSSTKRFYAIVINIAMSL